jgi:hypothetical protein
MPTPRTSTTDAGHEVVKFANVNRRVPPSGRGVERIENMPAAMPMGEERQWFIRERSRSQRSISVGCRTDLPAVAELGSRIRLRCKPLARSIASVTSQTHEPIRHSATRYLAR